MAVYLIECSVCGKQYNSSTVMKFNARANNYKSTNLNFRKERKLSNLDCNHKLFHVHFKRNNRPWGNGKMFKAKITFLVT